VREYWLFLIGHQAYTANLSINPSVIPFVKPGDRVTITYVPGSAPYSITAMTDITLSHMP
jgi:hypothetical protein